MSRPESGLEERLWSLILDLSAQLTANKQSSQLLQTQATDLQGQAVHAKSGYALRRFNVDLTQEVFTSELERLNAQLTQENTTLSHESKQLGALLRECETTLETVMGKFRSFSHAAQQYGLDLAAYYEARLEKQTDHIDALAHREYRGYDAAVGRLSALVRDTLRVVEGEDEETDTDAALEQATELEQLRAENAMLRSVLDMHAAEEQPPPLAPPTDVPAASTAAAPVPPLPRAPIDEVDVGGASASAPALGAPDSRSAL